jgi:hypothetical protein
MTSNIAATVFNLLVVAFFAVAVIGVALGTYAAVSLKRRESEQSQQ